MPYAGYARILERHGIPTAKLHHQSWISPTPSRQVAVDDLVVEESFPLSYGPDDTDYDQLVFALKYDGIDLAALARIFARIDRQALTDRIRQQPTSKYARRIFFLFERLTGQRLDLPDTPNVGHVGVLDDEIYYTAAKGDRLPRYRLIDNLLGEIGGFCPFVRRTSKLDDLATRELGQRARDIVSRVDPVLLTRAIHFLYSKETRSSFAIEHEEPGDREDRFIGQLARVAHTTLDDEAELTDLQRSIVNPKYRESGFREAGSLEVYIGESNFHGRERVHHVGARSVSTVGLMKDWARMRRVEGPGAAVVEAACKAFSFVFIHPFGDGNGRIHRLLLHHGLARREFLPANLIVPISSVILADTRRYDAVLEDFSRRVLPQVEYRLDRESGQLTILNDPDDFYRYPDLTVQSEATYEWLERAIEHDLVDEIDFLRRHDAVIAGMRQVIDMPDKQERLFIKLCLGNQGKLSKAKRDKLFAELTDDEVARLEEVFQRGFEGFTAL